MGSPAVFSGRRTKLLSADGILTSDGSILDNNGQINYVKNGHAEVDTSGWALFADGATLVDGTGGTPTATFTRTTTNPLRGQASFLYTPGTLGDGARYQIITDITDRAKVLQISFDYELSGTITDGDYQVWVYDVINSQLIQPAGYKLSGTSGTYYKFSGTFQTSSSSSLYRIIVWQSVSTSVTLKLDNVSVSPQVVSTGGIPTDWQSYTPTSSWSSNVVHTGKWKRVGDTMYIKTRSLLSGGSENATYRIDLPAGYTVDTSKLPSTTATGVVLGYGSVLDNGVNNYPVGVWYGSTTSVNAFTLNAAGTYAAGAYVAQAVPITGNIGASDEINLEFSVPITGWGTSMQLSSDSSEGRVVAFKAYKTATQAIAGQATVTFSTSDVVTDKLGMFVDATDRVDIKVPGLYRITTRAKLPNSASAQDVGYNIDGGAMVTVAGLLGNATYSGTQGGADLVELSAGQYVQMQVNGSGSLSNFTFIVERISGNQTIAASETYSARYYSTAGQSIPNTGINVINFDTKDKDTHGSVTTGSGWLFTAQAPGEFSVSATVWAQAAAWTAGQIAYLSIYKNPTISSGAVTGGTIVNDGNLFNGFGATLNVGLNVTDKVKLLAGETVCITMTQNRTGGAVSLSTSAQRVNVQITRTGNY